MGERVRARRICLPPNVPDLRDVDAEQAHPAVDGLLDFVLDPATAIGFVTDQNNCHACATQSTVDQCPERRVATKLCPLPQTVVKKALVREPAKGVGVAHRVHAEDVARIVETEEGLTGHQYYRHSSVVSLSTRGSSSVDGRSVPVGWRSAGKVRAAARVGAFRKRSG